MKRSTCMATVALIVAAVGVIIAIAAYFKNMDNYLFDDDNDFLFDEDDDDLEYYSSDFGGDDDSASNVTEFPAETK